MKAGICVVYSVQDPLLCDLLFMTKNMFNNQLMSVINILDTETHEQQESDRKCKKRVKFIFNKRVRGSRSFI
ncbi:hypothetical protein BK138_32415 [Paenibacillus rhizosphaerae]|uniref:Uncharacterized protein n=1 Tax=Paenibacillus rhizosphaerae TaxID=297318 RepID=A0A1R1E542_9BACL|nr:hypothetical protein BK138_32415 [Paenibacillus rhizosphaerae]